MRNLLIGILFHDFDHSGLFGNDDLNIERALRGLRKYILDDDRDDVEYIEPIIRATEYPYTISSQDLSLSQFIIRDADLSQALNVAWIQQVVLGLAKEWNQKPIDVLKSQEPFLKILKFETQWAKDLYPEEKIKEKIEEARELFEILEEKDKK